MKLRYFIKVKTFEMNKDLRTLFYTAVREILGSSVKVVKSTDKEGNPSNTKMFHKVVDGEHWYIVPLERSPIPDQVDAIVSKLNSIGLGDFTIETSLIEHKDIFDNGVSKDDYDRIAEQFAQKIHEDWLNDRISNGWRYGDLRDDSQKTHPLVKNWSQLSARDKNIKPQLVNEFVNILKLNGFKITKK